MNNILSWKESIDFLKKTDLLSHSGSLIAQKIVADGRIFVKKFSSPERFLPILDVHRFLNHRVEPELMDYIGQDLAKILKPYKPDLIVTAASSGIAPTQVTSYYLKVPYVFAKKAASATFSKGSYKASSFSITEQKPIHLYISKLCLDPKMRVVILDDFLDLAILVGNLMKITLKANCSIQGAGFLIEKSESNGRNKLKRYIASSQIHSLLTLEKIEKGRMKVANIPYTFSLKNQS